VISDAESGISALDSHRETLRGGRLPSPRELRKQSFVHGALLPLSLISTALRTPAIRGPYLKLLAIRVAVLFVLAYVVSDGGAKIPKRRAHPSLELHASEPVDVSLPGIRLRIPKTQADGGAPETGLTILTDGGIQNADISLRAHGNLNLPRAPQDGGATDLDIGGGDLTVAGIRIPLNEAAEEASRRLPKHEEAGSVSEWLSDSWARLLAIFATLSAIEVVIVFFSRKWDDAISFELSRAAGIVPEDPVPPKPRMGADFGWAYRKVKRKVRGTLVFVAGLPILLPIHLVPVLGDWAFTGVATLWGWYWVGAFAAGKSAHAWIDSEKADAPLPLRKVRALSTRGRLMWPVRVYTRLWDRVTRELYPAVTTFEKNPRTFLGLGLTRVVFSIPILYLFFRPILPVAAGRICAESDPEERFTLRGEPPQISP